MTVESILKMLERCVSKGDVTFIRRAVTAVAGNVNFWVETVHPEFDTSPLEYLAFRKLVPGDPPYGLSWDDYMIVVNASHGSGGPEDPWVAKLVESCKATRRVRFLDE